MLGDELEPAVFGPVDDAGDGLDEEQIMLFLDHFEPIPKALVGAYLIG